MLCITKTDQEAKIGNRKIIIEIKFMAKMTKLDLNIFAHET